MSGENTPKNKRARGVARMTAPRGLWCTAIAMACMVTAARAETVEWIKGGDGIWSEEDVWSPYAPYSTDSVLINQGTVSILRRTSFDVVNLTVGSAGGLSLQSNLRISGDLRSEGNLTVGGTYLAAPNLTVSGNTWLGGTGQTLFASGVSTQPGNMSTGALTVDTGHTLTGMAGTVRATEILNKGVIQASQGYFALSSITSTGFATTLVNQGVLRATNGGNLSIAGFKVDNTAGVIDLVDGGVGTDSSTSYGVQGGIIQGHGDRSSFSGYVREATFLGTLRSGGLNIAGTVYNNGVLNLDSGAYTVSLRRVSDDGVLAGQGEVNVLNDGAVNLYGTVFGAGQTFRGGATVYGEATNQGTFIVRGAQGLQIDTYGTPGRMVNQGTMTVANGSQLVLRTGTLDNTGGTLSFEAGSLLSGINSQHFTGWIVGGSVRGDAAMRLEGQVAFKDVTLEGDWISGPNGTLGALGTITVNGTLVIGRGAGYSSSYLDLEGDTVLAGRGETVLASGEPYGYSEIRTAHGTGNGYPHLTIAEEHTLRGKGIISADVVNKGLALAEGGFGLQFNGPVRNVGTLRAVGAALRLTQGIDNHGGVIDLREGSQLYASQSVVGGVIQGQGDSSRIGAYELQDVTLKGSLAAVGYAFPSGGSFGVYGRVTNEGVLRLGGVAADGEAVGGMVVHGAAILDGSGRTEISRGQGYNAAILGVCCGVNTLTIGERQTVVGYGDVNSVDITNDGTIQVTGGDLHLYGSASLVNRANLHVDATGTLRADTALTQVGENSRLVVDGRLETTSLELKGGVLSGTGVITGALNVDAATVRVGADAGALTLNGKFSAGADSILSVAFGGDVGAGAPPLFVLGDAALDGLLILTFDAQASEGSSFDILQGSGLVTGTFSRIDVRGTDLIASVQYSENGVSVSLVSSVPEAGSAWLLLLGLVAMPGAVRLARRGRDVTVTAS